LLLLLLLLLLLPPLLLAIYVRIYYAGNEAAYLRWRFSHSNPRVVWGYATSEHRSELWAKAAGESGEAKSSAELEPSSATDFEPSSAELKPDEVTLSPALLRARRANDAGSGSPGGTRANSRFDPIEPIERI